MSSSVIVLFAISRLDTELSIMFALATELLASSLAPIASGAISAATNVLSWISELSIVLSATSSPEKPGERSFFHGYHVPLYNDL